MFLMLKDKPVLQFDVDEGKYTVLEPELLPYSLRGAFKEKDAQMPIEKQISINQKNWSTLISFLSKRVLSLDRENAKKLLNAYRLSQSQDPIEKAKIAIICKAVSMIDNYWLNNNEMSLKWDNLDPKRVHLNEIVSHIMLFGKSLTATGEPHTPELTGHGAYAKAWVRTEDGLFLFKKSSIKGIESDIEASVSRILDCFNVPHVEYTMDALENVKLCKCKNMATDDYCIVPAEEIYSYCARNNIDFINFVLNEDSEMVYKMCIVDYLISNPDRHMMNWGFYMSNDTGHLLGCHPLFDHNNAFDESIMEQKDGGRNLLFGNSMKEAALNAIKHCDFRCIASVTRDMFLTEEMYESFMSRAVELGLYREKKQKLLQKIGIIHSEKYEPIQLKTNNYSLEHVDRLFQTDKGDGFLFEEHPEVVASIQFAKEKKRSIGIDYETEHE